MNCKKMREMKTPKQIISKCLKNDLFPCLPIKANNIQEYNIQTNK